VLNLAIGHHVAHHTKYTCDVRLLIRYEFHSSEQIVVVAVRYWFSVS